MEDNIEIAIVWIEAQSLNPDDSEFERFSWASEFLINEVHTNPRKVFEIVLEIVKRNPSQQVLSQLGAGPLEDIIVYHGTDFIDDMEREAGSSSEFRFALSYVWLEKSNPLGDRLAAIVSNQAKVSE